MGCKGKEGGKKKAEIDAQKVIHTTLSPIEIIIYFFLYWVPSSVPGAATV